MIARSKDSMAHAVARTFRLCRVGGRVSAFSTLEVLAAIVVSLILASIGLASMRLYQVELPISGSGNRLCYAFSTARTMAISRNSTFAVVINTDYSNFWINELDSNGNTVAAKVVTPETIDPRVAIAEIIPAPTTSEAIFKFFPDGHSDNGAVYLKLKSRLASLNTGDFTTVRVYGPTGQSRVFERNQVIVP